MDTLRAHGCATCAPNEGIGAARICALLTLLYGASGLVAPHMCGPARDLIKTNAT